MVALTKLMQSTIEVSREDEMTRASLSVVLAVALCTGWSTAQAAPPKLQLHPDTIKALGEAWALAAKEARTAPPPKTETPSLWVKANNGLKLAADTVTRLTVLVGAPVGLCHWYHWYEWCDSKDSNDHHHDHE